ncbi:6965_t:CDS:2 [Ambispora gerdemannii]|uniref:6965_t:CDS:1 n=1 Tax=Ambispora gerdemannii TaxID=144530 RepID=A0A9N9FZ04_9GLOM|nr:6965_t:CDS:2 [Ambispora gerdemannii]
MNITKARNTSVENDKNPSLEENNSNVADTTKNDSDESKALTIKHRIQNVRRHPRISRPQVHVQPQGERAHYSQKIRCMWNENHPDFQITVGSIEEWTYREDEDPSRYNCHWGEYGD